MISDEKDLKKYQEVILNVKNFNIILSDQNFFLGNIGSTKLSTVFKKFIKKDLLIYVYGNIYNLDSVIDILKYNEIFLSQKLINNLSNGEFVLIIHDFKRNLSYLLTDKMGIIKVYYYYSREKGILFFSTRIQTIKQLLSALASELNVNLTFDSNSLYQFLKFGFFMNDNTLIKDIKVFSGSSLIYINENRLLYINKFWEFKYKSNFNISLKLLSDNFLKIWLNAIKIRVKRAKHNSENGKKILIPISGGLDSRLILASIDLLTKKYNWINKEDFLCFSYGIPNSFDFEIGKFISKKLNFEHLELKPDFDSFQTQSNECISFIEGMKFIHDDFPPLKYKNVLIKHGTEIITGFPADIFLKSYCQNKTEIELKIEDPLLQQKYLTKFIERFVKFKDNEIKDLLKIGINLVNQANPIQAQFSYVWDILDSWNINIRANNHSWYGVFRFNHIFNYYVPFYDSNVVEFVSNLSPILRYNEFLKDIFPNKLNFYNYFLKEKFGYYFNFPTKNNMGLSLFVPKNSPRYMFNSLLYNIILLKINNVFKKNLFIQKNINYINFNHEILTNNSFREFIVEILHELKKAEIFNYYEIVNLLKKVESNEIPFRNFSYLITLHIFYKLYIKND